MHGLCYSLYTKLNISNKINLKNAEYENLEALALAHIYIVLVVLIQYEPMCETKLGIDVFSLKNWIAKMQNVLVTLKKETFGWYSIQLDKFHLNK